MSAVSPVAPPQASRAVRALALAGASVTCALAAGVLTITILGSHSGPMARLVLSAPLQTAQHPVGTVTAPTHGAVRQPVKPVAPAPITKPVYAGRALLADPALIENTAEGPLPRVAADGRTPMTAYAASAPAGKYRIAIVVRGLGISAQATQAALDNLPPAVTLAFAPYAHDVGRWVAQARKRGHEVLLEIPMEPYDFPDSDPGPHTLQAGRGEGANLDRLKWALTRFTGYAGVTNLLGQRFLSDSDALSPVLTYLAQHGLYFFDNGSATQSVAPLVAGQVGAPVVQANAAVDTVQAGLEIDHRLADLEHVARADGQAAGSAFLYPVSVARIAAWAKGLKARGFVLVPASAIVRASK